MKALCWYGTEDVRVDTVPDPKILDPRDAVIKSSLHKRSRRVRPRVAFLQIADRAPDFDDLAHRFCRGYRPSPSLA